MSWDHAPIVFHLNPKGRCCRLFRYEAMWEEHEDCKEVIKQGWGGEVTGLDKWETLLSKVKNCKETLQLWHKRTFKNANIEIRRLKQNAQARLDQASSEIDWAKVKNLQAELMVVETGGDLLGAAF